MPIYKQVVLSSPLILSCALTSIHGYFISSHLKKEKENQKTDHVLSALLIFRSCCRQGEIILMGCALAGPWTLSGALSCTIHLCNVKKSF